MEDKNKKSLPKKQNEVKEIGRYNRANPNFNVYEHDLLQDRYGSNENLEGETNIEKYKRLKQQEDNKSFKARTGVSDSAYWTTMGHDIKMIEKSFPERDKSYEIIFPHRTLKSQDLSDIYDKLEEILSQNPGKRVAINFREFTVLPIGSEVGTAYHSEASFISDVTGQKRIFMARDTRFDIPEKKPFYDYTSEWRKIKNFLEVKGWKVLSPVIGYNEKGEQLSIQGGDRINCHSISRKTILKYLSSSNFKAKIEQIYDKEGSYSLPQLASEGNSTKWAQAQGLNLEKAPNIVERIKQNRNENLYNFSLDEIRNAAHDRAAQKWKRATNKIIKNRFMDKLKQENFEYSQDNSASSLPSSSSVKIKKGGLLCRITKRFNRS